MLKVEAWAPGERPFPIRYEQGYFIQRNQRAGAEVLFARPSRALLVQAVRLKKRDARPPRLCAGRAALAPGSLGDALARLSNRTATAITGQVAMVLPDGILGAPGLGHVREWILSHTRVLAYIDLHPDTFQPSVSVQTSLLVLHQRA